MSKWNLRLDDNLVELEGRVLEPEIINYSDRSVRYKQQEADWSRDGKCGWKQLGIFHPESDLLERIAEVLSTYYSRLSRPWLSSYQTGSFGQMACRLRRKTKAYR
jgi:hypothetical protein